MIKQRTSVVLHLQISGDNISIGFEKAPDWSVTVFAVIV
jgi:hypothetical protein